MSYFDTKKIQLSHLLILKLILTVTFVVKYILATIYSYIIAHNIIKIYKMNIINEVSDFLVDT